MLDQPPAAAPAEAPAAPSAVQPPAPAPSAAPPTPEASAGQSAPAAPAAAPAAPAPAPASPQLQQVEARLQYLGQLEQALQWQDAAEQQALQQYGRTLPPEALQGMLAEYQATAQQRAVAAQGLQMQRANYELERQRHLLETPARIVTHHTLIREAQKLDPGIDESHMEAFLQQFRAPEDVVAGARAYVQFRREAGTAQRAANGTDRMGGPGGAAGVDFSQMSETDLYKLGIEQSERRAAQRR